MRVKVHPHKTKVNAGLTQCVSVTPDRKGGRATYSAYVGLANVEFRVHDSGVKRARKEKRRNVHAWAVGELVIRTNQRIPVEAFGSERWVQVTYHYEVGRFMTVDGIDVTDQTFPAAICNGRDFYVRA